MFLSTSTNKRSFNRKTFVRLVLLLKNTFTYCLLKNSLLPRSNMFAYGQVESPYGSGQFIKDLREHFREDERVVVSEIQDKDGIVGSIKDFLGKGR